MSRQHRDARTDRNPLRQIVNYETDPFIGRVEFLACGHKVQAKADHATMRRCRQCGLERAARCVKTNQEEK